MSALIEIVVTPNASQNIVLPLTQPPLRVRLTSSPVESKANSALVKILSKTLSVPQKFIRIRHGKTSKRKLIEIDHMDQELLENRLRNLKNFSSK
ncbi:MAG: DUF167 domain-containing protein [Puniceicoccales bacterium]|nr:DUF167 domain-containing protein [Puniceicoccales bacterium]